MLDFLHAKESHMMPMNKTKSLIESDGFRNRILDIYGEEEVEFQIKRYTEAMEQFEKLFSAAPVSFFSAPGRTEIGGNHTDHQHGEVLAASINRDAIAAASPTDDGSIRVLSEGYPMIEFTLPGADASADSGSTGTGLSPLPEEAGTTRGLIRGVIAGIQARGYRIGGFNAYITSNVLGGSGLSSSAAFETLIGTILSGLYNEGSIDAVTIAVIGQYAENVYFGKPCGLMDQMACSVGSLCHMDFADPADPKLTRIEFDLDKAGYSLCITDTKGSHADLTPDYAAVPAEMKAVAAFFGKEVLREVPESEMAAAVPALREKLGDRPVLRAFHFYKENRRVEAEANALSTGDIRMFLRAVRASGDSSYKFLQNVYTTHDIRHQNMSVALAVSESVLGLSSGNESLLETGVVRVHGGGFAGTIQAFVPKDKTKAYQSAMDALFGEGSCMVLKIRKYGGITVI